MRLFLLVLHGISALLLVGAVTHQAIAVWWPSASGPGFWRSLRATHPERYAGAVIALFAITLLLGSVLYVPFSFVVRAEYLDRRLPWATGLFEIKEHAAAIGLCLLPAYWAVWRAPGHVAGRRAATTFLLVFAWWNFVIGHVVNDLRGL
ncbi:MAG: hypothetical protein E6K80_13530 [Candidatus Eisenbacteria bacterium]|uniref:DUF2269 family protein n=1 Tax=Eiseniibacteriota bacterium TaxID=2212470 RepID=A0A538TZC1_UNCEI|nr:MAG: hypothetical protein E6K80_13530 [Candidatus Eisenbacteria bacterium]